MTELEFLHSHLPQSDLDCYGEDLLRQFAEHGAYLRKNVPWCKELEQELFEHYVLSPRINDEDLSFYSQLFFDALWKRIAPMDTMEERILEVNRWCGEQANYQMQDERTASPLTVFRNGSGRCGEESAFLVAALRSVGIPARQVYAPRWAHCDDNHAWVEAWCDGAWRFLGACEPEPVLDRGWFNTPASRALLIHSRTFGTGSGDCHGQLISREGCVSWYNQTGRYAQTQNYRFRVLRDGEPAPGAKIHIQILNESSFHTVATLTADAQGMAGIEMGLGDFHILAEQEELWAQSDCSGEETVLRLRPMENQTTAWRSFDVHAPQSSRHNESILGESQKNRREADQNRCALRRSAREKGFCQFAAKYPQWEELLLQARENGQTVARFLEAGDHARGEALLRSLAQKDLRDVTADVLNDHLQASSRREDIPADVYNRYVLCPRISLEPLRPWRQTLQKEFAVFRENPEALWDFLTDRMEISSEQTYKNLCRTPLESWRSRRCDEKSLHLLYVAALRSLEIPARLDPLDGKPEYWDKDRFVAVQPQEQGLLRLTGEASLVYKQEWTLSRWTGREWQLLNVRENDREIKLPVGLYRLITTRRMPNGNQLAAWRNLTVSPGKTTESDLYLRPYALADMLGSQSLLPMSGCSLDGREEILRTDRPGLLLWLEVGREPTEHLMVELLAQADALNALALDVTVLLQNQKCLQDATLTKLIQSVSGIRVLLDDWNYDLETTARCLTCDPDTPPLAVVCDEDGNAVFATSGYRVGIGKLLADIGAYIAEQGEG